MAAKVPQFKLNNGVLLPSVGLGCWMGEPGGGQRAYDMVTKAVKIGYRHFDTADGYKNEELVGKAIRDSGVPRKEFFVTTKLSNSEHHRVAEAFEQSLKALDIDYIDLYLVHWPQATIDGKTLQPEEHPTIQDTWAEVVKLLDTGKVRALGVSNFGVPLLEALLKTTKVVPAVNQVELHPFLPSVALRKYSKEHGILLTAYSPIGQPQAGTKSPLLTDEDVVRIAEKYGATPAQVALSWGVQHGIVVVPKSENEDRLKSNITLLQLDDDDVRAIDAIYKKDGKHRSLIGYHSDDGTVFGWTYEQLGWNQVSGGKGTPGSEDV